METVKPVMFETPDEDDVEAEHLEPDPEGGWRGADLTDDEISDDDYADQFVAHEPITPEE